MTFLRAFHSPNSKHHYVTFKIPHLITRSANQPARFCNFFVYLPWLCIYQWTAQEVCLWKEFSRHLPSRLAYKRWTFLFNSSIFYLFLLEDSSAILPTKPHSVITAFASGRMFITEQTIPRNRRPGILTVELHHACVSFFSKWIWKFKRVSTSQ